MFTLMDTVRADLRARYAEPHRAHHDQGHIDALLAQWQREWAVLHDPCAVELAIWFHDAVYVPGARDNERQSAELLRQSLSGFVESSIVEKAVAMILATERHIIPTCLPQPLADDTCVFLDMDISILGANAAEYDLYALHIRQEFLPVVGEEAWLEGRSAFLRSTLEAATPLFHTAAARARFDTQARINMRRELTGLNGKDG